jgi:predicted RNase H-like HicB family nuclease
VKGWRIRVESREVTIHAKCFESFAPLRGTLCLLVFLLIGCEVKFCSIVSTSMEYPVVLVHSEEGYAVGCPSIPGCWSQGATREEALANIQDAIRSVLEVTQELEWQQWMEEGLTVETTSVELSHA